MKIMVLKQRVVKYVAGLALALSVTACATTENATRNAVLLPVDPAVSVETPSYSVAKLSVMVPQDLTVSEANLYLPGSDIVWREDPAGDRKKQVQTILADAIAKGASTIQDGQLVSMEVRLNQFHALSEKARYTIGGRHDINFDYLLRDLETGVPVAEVKNIDISFKAHGGKAAIAAEARGETQKLRITQHIAALMQQELSGDLEI